VKAKVYVTLKKAVLDPQGKAVERALQRLGYPEVKGVRVGKFIEMELDSKDREKSSQRIEEMCQKLLSNPVIENAHYEFAD